MSWRKSLKIVQVLVASLVGIMAVAAVGLYIYFFKPYLAYSEQRLSAVPETIRVRYMAYACGEFYPQLYELVRDGKGETRESDTPTTLALPAGLPSPERGELSFAGNVFELTGYRYLGHERNRLTGSSRRVPSSRFDVVAWRVEAPYRILSPDAPPESPMVLEQQSEPIGHSVANDDHVPANFTMEKYNHCP